MDNLPHLEVKAESKTFDNLDGTYSTEISQKPIHFRDENGKWEEIDNKLIEKEKDKIQNVANDFKVEFDKTATKENLTLSSSDEQTEITMGLVERDKNSKKATLQKKSV